MLLVVVNYFELWVMPYHSVLQGFREVDVIPQRSYRSLQKYRHLIRNKNTFKKNT